MEPLQGLKEGLLSGLSKDKQEAYNLCTVMEMVGGYSELLKLPLPALSVIMEYLEWKKKQDEKTFKPKKNIK